jgi:ribosome-associated protein
VGPIDVGAARPLDDDELEVRFSRSGGPGGQHVNTSATRVEVVLDLARTPALSDAERSRAMRRLASRLDADGRLRVVAQDTRSQARNRELAVRRLVELLRDALAPPPPPRRPTRPSRAARAARLEGKRRAGEAKRLRRPPERGDD